MQGLKSGGGSCAPLKAAVGLLRDLLENASFYCYAQLPEKEKIAVLKPRLNVMSLSVICVIAVSVVLLYRDGKAKAQSSDMCGCNSVLIPSVRIVASSKRKQLAYLKIVDKASFDELKKSSGGGGSIEIGPVSIGGNASWDEFVQKREKYFEQEQIDLDYSEALNLITSGLPEYVTAAWATCKESCGTSGFKCWLVDSGKDTVTITCAWTPPVGAGEGVVTSSSLTGGSSDSAPAGKGFPNQHKFAINSRESFLFRRTPGETFRLVANVSGYTTNLVVSPPAPPAPPAPIPRPPMNINIDTILCSGVNCDLEHIRRGQRNGDWQVVRWEASSVATKGLGPQLSVPEDASKDAFCKSSGDLTTSDLRDAVQDVSFRVTDNSEQAQFFDLDGVQRDYFEWSSGGRFYFFNNYEKQANHHIRLNITLTLKRASCQ